MAKAANEIRREARRLFLTGEMATNAEIAAHVRVKPHTVGLWRKQEDWDGLRRKIDRRAAEMLVEKLATGAVVIGVILLLASVIWEQYQSWLADPYRDVHR